jgi:hypothetical protein
LLILIRWPWKSQMPWAAIVSVRYCWENKADCGYWYIFVWTLLAVKIAFFCGVIPCRFLDRYQEFGGMCCLFLQDRISCYQISPVCWVICKVKCIWTIHSYVTLCIHFIVCLSMRSLICNINLFHFTPIHYKVRDHMDIEIVKQFKLLCKLQLP